MDQFFAVNRLKRQAYYLGTGEWGVKSKQVFDDKEAVYRYVKFGTWTETQAEELGDDLELVLRGITEDLDALNVHEIVRWGSDAAMEFFDYTMIGSRYRTKWTAQIVPPGTSVKQWMESLK